MPASELVALLGSENRTPTIVPNTADANNFGSDTTPTIEFTGSDTESDDVSYEVQIDTVNTFDSQGGGADNALLLSDNGALYKTTDQVDNNISFFCWIKKSADGSKDIFLNGNNGTYGKGFSFRLNSSNKLVIDLSYLAELASSFDLTGDSNWHFVGFTRNSGTWKIYLDGASEVVGTTSPYGITSNEKIVIASKNSDGAIAYNFDGYIARVGYWQSVISDANIASLLAGATVASIGGAYIDLPLNDSGAWGTNGGSGGNLTTDGTLTLGTDSFDAIPGIPLLKKLSNADAGFANTVSGGDTDPFNSGEKVSFTVQAGNALSAGTYYWRARAKDPSGSENWSDWTTARSFSISNATTYSKTKSLSYAVKTTPSAKTKSLSYDIKTTPGAKTKSISYSIVRTPSAKTDTLSYSIKYTPSAKTKSEKYSIKTTPSAKTKSESYSVKTTPSAKTKSEAYSVKQTLSKTKAEQYAVKTSAQKTKPDAYSVKTSGAKTKTLRYLVSPENSVTKSLSYAVGITASAIAKSQAYRVQNSHSNTESLSYGVKTSQSKTKSLQYHLSGTGTHLKTASLSYDVKTSKSNQKTTSYRILTNGVKQKSDRYSVKRTIQITKSESYAILSKGTKTKTLLYEVILERPLQKSTQYALKSGKQISKSISYVVVDTSSITKSVTYAVDSSPVIQKHIKYVLIAPHAIEKNLSYSIVKYPYTSQTVPFSRKTKPYTQSASPYRRILKVL